MPAKPLLSSSTSLARARGRDCGPAALVRVCRIHGYLKNNQEVTAESLARDLEISSRTIKRDLDLMRDRLGAPIEWDNRLRTYRYTRPCDLLPLLWLHADEALALALAGRTFASWHGSPLGRALTAALEKIAPAVGHVVSLPASALTDLLFEAEDPAADAEHRCFAQLLEAIHRRRALRLGYQKPKAGAALEDRAIQPLHLAYLDHRWVLLAYDVSRRAIRSFLLARIRRADPTGGHFEPPADFRPKQYLSGSLGRFIGEKDYEVRIAFDAEAAPYLRERPWHRSQTIVERPDGGIEITLRLNHLNDVARRVLACGEHAEVLAPAELRARLRATAATLHARYA